MLRKNRIQVSDNGNSREFQVSAVILMHEPRTCCVKITSLRGGSGLNAAFYLNVTIYHDSTFLRSGDIGGVYCTE